MMQGSIFFLIYHVDLDFSVQQRRIYGFYVNTLKIATNPVDILGVFHSMLITIVQIEGMCAHRKK